MTQIRYNLEILTSPWGTGDGFGYGVNDFGVAVGEVVAADYNAPAIWMPGQPVPCLPFGPNSPSPAFSDGQLNAVDDFGNAVGNMLSDSTNSYFIVNCTALIADLSSLGGPTDINNNATVIGIGPNRAFIYTFLPIPGNTIWLSPLPNSTSIWAWGINDLGDVVGGCDNNAGFFYSASTQKMTGIDSCFLSDINVNRLAVGQTVTGNSFTDQPIMVDLSKTTPVVQTFPAPKPFAGAFATAVNSSGTIVGVCNRQTQFDQCAFVYYDGKAHDLNALLAVPSSYYLVDAMDINEAGQIVGSAVTGLPDQITGVYAYRATPYELPPPPVGPWPHPVGPWPIHWPWFPVGTPIPWPLPPIPPSQIWPSPMLRLASQVSRMPITGKRPDFQKILAAHRARITHPTVSKEPRRRKNKKHR